MILFYDKTRGNRIFHIIQGRLHPEAVIEKSCTQTSDIPHEQIGKYVVPWKALTRKVKEPVTEARVITGDDGIQRVKNVLIGYQEVEQGAGVAPDVPFAELILAFEDATNPADPFDHSIVENEKGEVINIIPIDTEG